MDIGFTLRWRKRWDKGYHRDPILWLMMDYFIDFANHTDREIFFKGAGKILIKRGDHIFGTSQLSVFLGIDRSLTRRKLKILEDIGFLTIKTTNKYSIASVVNYDTYQSKKFRNDQQNDHQSTIKKPSIDYKSTINRPSNDHQTTIKRPHLKN